MLVRDDQADGKAGTTPHANQCRKFEPMYTRTNILDGKDILL